MVNPLTLRAEAADLCAKASAFATTAGANADEIRGNTAKAKELREKAEALIAQAKEIEELEARNAEAANKTPHFEVRDNKTDMPFASTGEFLIAVRNADTGRGFDPRLEKRAPSGMNTQVDADGGFLVGTDFSNTILQKTYNTGEILNRVSKATISSGADSMSIPFINETARTEGSRFGGVQVFMANQADTVTPKKINLNRFELRLNKIMALGYVTDEMLQDAGILESVLLESFRKEIAFKLEEFIMHGTGAGQPLGILNPSNAALVTVSKESGPQTADTVLYANIVKMRSRLWARSRANSIWTINQDVEPQLHLMTSAGTSSAVPVFLPAGGASASPYDTLYGRPIVPTEYNETLGDKGDIALIDFSEYLFVTKGSVQEAASMHVRFEYGEMAYRLQFRMDGQPTWKTALTPNKGSNTLSPYVVLEAR